MAINPNLVGVPAQSKNLDTATTTTTAGLVHRQVISLADPETATNMRVYQVAAYKLAYKMRH